MEWMTEMAGHGSYRREVKSVWLCFFLFPTFVTLTCCKDAAGNTTAVGLGFLWSQVIQGPTTASAACGPAQPSATQHSTRQWAV